MPNGVEPVVVDDDVCNARVGQRPRGLNRILRGGLCAACRQATKRMTLSLDEVKGRRAKIAGNEYHLSPEFTQRGSERQTALEVSNTERSRGIGAERNTRHPGQCVMPYA